MRCDHEFISSFLPSATILSTPNFKHSLLRRACLLAMLVHLNDARLRIVHWLKQRQRSSFLLLSSVLTTAQMPLQELYQNFFQPQSCQENVPSWRIPSYCVFVAYVIGANVVKREARRLRICSVKAGTCSNSEPATIVSIQFTTLLGARVATQKTKFF